MADFRDMDYEDVASRLARFHEKHPNGRIVPVEPLDPFQILKPYGEDGPSMIVCQMAVYRDQDDAAPAGVGIAWELLPGRTPYTKGSELMVAQTSAIGRALAFAGFSARKSIATRQEVDSARARQGVPVEGKRPARPTVTPTLEVSHD